MRLRIHRAFTAQRDLARTHAYFNFQDAIFGVLRGAGTVSTDFSTRKL